jgi:anion-transporting  ArsA/GET3 family ATPase
MITTPSGLMGFDALSSSNVVMVTGKGGVGKTTAAAAIALAAVASGRRTILVEVEGRQGFSRTFGTAPWDYQPREFRPDLWGMAIDPAEAVYEYLDRFYGLKRVHWVMERSHALDFVTTAAPGLKDLLLLGKVYDLEIQRRADGRRRYDLIVVDAPPTGRIVPFLRAPEGVTEIVRVGPIQRQAGSMWEMLQNPKRLRAVVVSLLEEMPVRETVEAVDALRDAGLDVGPVIANQVVVPRLSAEAAEEIQRLGGEELRARVTDAGARMSGRTTDLLLEVVTDHRDRVDLQASLRDELADACSLPVLSLPLMTGATFGSPDLEVLGDLLALQVGEEGPHAAERYEEEELDQIVEMARPAPADRGSA